MSFADGISLSSFNGLIAEECLRLSKEPSSSENAGCDLICSSSKHRALCTGNTVSLFRLEAFEVDEVASELEFDTDIVCATWDITESCVVIGDAGGCLHLVTGEGALLFSKKIIAGDFHYLS